MEQVAEMETQPTKGESKGEELCLSHDIHLLSSPRT